MFNNHPHKGKEYDDDEDPYLQTKDINEEEIRTLNTVFNNHPHKGKEHDDDEDIYLDTENIDEGEIKNRILPRQLCHRMGRSMMIMMRITAT